MTETTNKTPEHDQDRRNHPDKNDAPRTGDKVHPDNAQDEMGRRLDEGLDETFPSSDPVSVKITK